MRGRNPFESCILHATVREVPLRYKRITGSASAEAAEEQADEQIVYVILFSC